MMSQKLREEAMWELLAKHGIRTEAELDEALKTLEPLNISCMASKVKTQSEDLLNITDGRN